MRAAADTGALADDLVAFTLDRLEELLAGPFSGWRVPLVYGGHLVGADVRADLCYTLGHLADAGVDGVAGRGITDALAELIAGVDGKGTHTFFSYRIAETLGRYGPFDANPLLGGASPDVLEQVSRACDSTDWLGLLDSGLPRNYGAVLARCEIARERLGLPVDPDVVADLVARSATLLSAPRGYHDDSEDGAGHRYDIYTLDLALFSEPLARHVGDTWRGFATRAVALAERTVVPEGAALTWGRSTGVLATCLTIELAGLVAASDGALGADPARWAGLGARAALGLDRWFEGGVCQAHSRRSPYAYRGPERRLQLTLDVLGKLAWTAARLRAAAPISADPEPFEERDEVVRFDDRSALWCHRSDDLVVDVPFVGPTRSDYQPAPRDPGTFEVPVDSSLPTWVPALRSDGTVHCGGGPPTSVEAVDGGGVVAEWSGFPLAGGLGTDDGLPGTRRTAMRADGRTLRWTEELTLSGSRPDVVSVTVPEARGRPLRVRFRCDAPHAAREVDVDGVGEWRSFWGEMPRVHEMEIGAPPAELTYEVEVMPCWRVASESGHHHYHRSLYDSMDGAVDEHGFSSLHLHDRRRAVERLADVDLFHLHWPEWFTGNDLGAARTFLDVLAEADVRLIWTQHNLRPHHHDDAYEELYAMTAAAAHGVIHHSAWGRDRVLAHHRFRTDACHAVIPHGHFGNLAESPSPEKPSAEMASPYMAAEQRAEAERELGLAPVPDGGLRIGVVGAPRADKRTVALMEAFAATTRDDLQLLVLSLGDGESAPEDDRITALPYEYVDRETYNRRLAAIDVIALPFAPRGDMLTTGVVADVIGWRRPALVSSWAYLTERLGDAGLALGDEPEEMTAAIERLDAAAVRGAAVAVERLAAETSWARVAELTLELFAAVGTAKL